MARFRTGPVLFLLIFSALETTAAIGSSDLPIFQLDVFFRAKDPHSYSTPAFTTEDCTFLSLRETRQTRKDLDSVVSTDSFVVERRPARSGATDDMNNLKFYSHSSNVLWKRAESICGPPRLWDFPYVVDIDEVEYRQILEDVEVKTSYADHVDEFEGSQLQLNAPDSPEQEEKQHALEPKLPLPPPPPLEIVPLSTTGPAENRIDLVFFGDGYTLEEKSKFLSDAKTLALDVSGNQTFATVKPLMNFWAAFTPSNQSGIGVGGQPKNTTFGLYRDGTELRGVYYALPNVARSACLSLGDACDYPILLGNDALYGGLGGTFTVTTASQLNGPLVLRHELGHSIIVVGEEYDGGFAYFGPNAAHSLSSPFPWSHWLTTPNISEPREERSVVSLQAYPWTLLNTTTAWSTSFTSPGIYERYLIRFSLSGIPMKEHLCVLLDGYDVSWMPRKDIGVDRWFYDLHFNKSLKGGKHELAFELGEGALIGQAQLCSIEVIEYGSAEEFNTTEGYIGAFPTFSEKNETSYRPTDEGCLMRLVTTPNFCSVCIEGLWLELAKRINLIDSIQTGCALKAPGLAKRFVKLKLLSLAQFRDDSSFAEKHSEAYIIEWSKDGQVLPNFTNQTIIEMENTTGNFSVHVRFVTDEVRLDDKGYLTANAEVEVKGNCIAGDA